MSNNSPVYIYATNAVLLSDNSSSSMTPGYTYVSLIE